MLTFWFCLGFMLGHFCSRAKSFSDIFVLGLDKKILSFSSLFRMWKIFSDIFTQYPRPGIYAVLVRARPGWCSDLNLTYFFSNDVTCKVTKNFRWVNAKPVATFLCTRVKNESTSSRNLWIKIIEEPPRVKWLKVHFNNSKVWWRHIRLYDVIWKNHIYES